MVFEFGIQTSKTKFETENSLNKERTDFPPQGEKILIDLWLCKE